MSESESTPSNSSSDSEANKNASRFEVIPIPKEIILCDFNRLRDTNHIVSRMDYSRRASRGAINKVETGNMRKFKRSLSATANIMPNVKEHNLKHFLTKEKLPHMDHYRQSVDFGKYTYNAYLYVFLKQARK